jgi:hypothetical protein
VISQSTFFLLVTSGRSSEMSVFEQLNNMVELARIRPDTYALLFFIHFVFK